MRHERGLAEGGPAAQGRHGLGVGLAAAGGEEPELPGRPGHGGGDHLSLRGPVAPELPVAEAGEEAELGGLAGGATPRAEGAVEPGPVQGRWHH